MAGGWWGRGDSKRQFLRRLHKRFGTPWPLTLEDGYVFETGRNRWRNLDQLEAIVEFYVNFRDPANTPCGPWRLNAQPISPGDAGYRTVSLRPPRGSTATLGANNWITLDQGTDLSLVLPNPAPAANPAEPNFTQNAGYPDPRRFLYSTIHLEADTARPSSKRYRIMEVDVAGRRVRVDAAPAFGAAVTSKWSIRTPPTLVVIDPVGVRQYANAPHLRGSQAQVQTSGAQALVDLDGGPNLSRVNVHFDTIYFATDSRTGRGRPFKAYRILELNVGGIAGRIRVDGDPSLDGGRSPWHIPAGLSADTVPAGMNYDLDPPVARRHLGYDHYDGLLFIVDDGAVVDWFRWTSYTSRQHGPWEPSKGAFGAVDGWDQSFSSIAGNTAYFYESFFSQGSYFRNYSLAVRDVTLTNGGPTQNRAADAVANAWYYFGTPQANVTLNAVVTQDLAPAAAAGKTHIRIHRGTLNGSGSGSDGCVVSPVCAQFKSQLIARYNQHYTAFHGPGSIDTQLPRICATPVCENATYGPPDAPQWPGSAQIPAADWNLKLAGIFWLIRPDEPTP